MKQPLLSASLCTLTIFRICFAADTLSANQTLTAGNLLVSPSKIFELGFFSPASTTTTFLGIWYKATPNVLVWVANRQNPIISSHGFLTLSRNGTLILTSTQGTIIWFSRSSITASTPVLRLLDTGNLVVTENSTYIWQSFDYPGDTRLPGMKMVNDPESGLDKHLSSWKNSTDPSVGDYVYTIENNGLPQMSVFFRREKRYRTGPWNGVYFTGLPFVGNEKFKPETVLENGNLISYSNPHTDSASPTRIVMSHSGLLQGYIMNEERNGWVLSLSEPSDACGRYGWCGPNGVCKQGVCECLKGFAPRSQEEWDVLVWSRGCGRTNEPLDCKKEDGFLEIERVKFPDTLVFRLDAGMSNDECRDECLKNCSCTAFAAPYLSSERDGCLMWFGDLIDVEELSGEVVVGPTIYIRVHSSVLDVMDQGKRKGPKKLVFIAPAAGFGMLVFCLCFVLRMKHQSKVCKKKREDIELPLFSFTTIAAATNNFSDEYMIGEGGFGPVYKGYLSAEQVIAVKRMSKTSKQGSQEFKNEVSLIAKLQHKNLVRLLGCCIEGEENMLIYEYMPNKSLDNFIFDETRSALLNWPKRFDIIMEIARGLVYLHHDSRLKIIHRDMKTSNILLDENLNARISDFGLARMFEGDQTTARTKRVIGTYGYMAPEYAFHGKFSVKSDVFSMGVVILEIVSGKKNRGFNHSSCYQNLLDQAWHFYKEKRELELMDPCYANSCVDSQVKRCIQVGLLCVQNAVDDRPMMSSVVLMLSVEATELPEPREPGFFLRSSCGFTQGNDASRVSLTISEVEGR